ncbi:HET-domain-containing protein [Glonium stellatum]|uniref:HET-domain-containing protein n=1 Tax=Glonium stellatum TaxID=574774 RepID=A0A8E2JWM0_9PEZI|nr:HET-domain-containing protein [Glonium stellatum]
MVSICKTCRGLQKSQRTPEGGASGALQWFNTTLPLLRRSATAGCRGCALILQGILLHHDRFIGVSEERLKISAESFLPGPDKQSVQAHLSVELRWKSREDIEPDTLELDYEEKYPDLKLEFYAEKDGQTPFSAIGRGVRISQDFLTDSGLEAARAMIARCLSGHPKCQYTKPGHFPKRLVAVTSDDGSNGVRIHESTDDNMEYLTLSHCWGSRQNVLKTTKSALASHCQSIPWSSLPKTFQDAVAITRSLGFRYIWIDSLCIVQDDPDDYFDESQKLSDIYSGSFLTIAATSAPDSSHGCFMPKQQPFKIQVTDANGSLYKIFVREQPSHHSFKGQFNEDDHMNDWVIPFNCQDAANAQTPLLKRAWAYEERLLSTRVLHFTQSEMILECMEGIQCECGRIDNPMYDPRTTDIIKRELANFTRTNDILAETHDEACNGVDAVASQLADTGLDTEDTQKSGIKEELIQLWSYIITEYTARDLTFDRDRLLAIAGIARQLLHYPILGSYIAGHWTCSTLNLLWYPSDPSHSRRSTSSKVPTWSWASVEGSPIYFDNTTAMDLACTANFPCEVGRHGDGLQKWAPTSGGRIEISAAMATEVVLRIDSFHGYSLTKNGVSVEFTPDVNRPEGDDKLAPGDTLICVLASMTYRSSITGFILKPLESQPDSYTYRRVGRFECYECDCDTNLDDPGDAEALLGLWFPEVEDMTELDNGPRRKFSVI